MWNRTAWLKLVGDKVVFDCSDEEYGPIEFDINLMTEAIQNHTVMRKEKSLYELQKDLINLYESQIQDLTVMSKIELGDDVIQEIRRLKALISEQTT